MSLVMWNEPFGFVRPSRILDQHFGSNLTHDDLFSPLLPRELRNWLASPAGYIRPWQSLESEQDAGSTVSYGKDKFQAHLDVQQFSPEEISVKVEDDSITVEGKHEEKEDDHGYISRHFVRRYFLPKGHDLQRVESKLSSDGVLTIVAPRVAEEESKNAKTVPITQTGEPAKRLESKEKQGIEEQKK